MLREEAQLPTAQVSDAGCAHCGGPVPEGRTRFCSDACLAQFKREYGREHYGHRHSYRCVECGHELHLGRRRKEIHQKINKETNGNKCKE